MKDNRSVFSSSKNRRAFLKNGIIKAVPMALLVVAALLSSSTVAMAQAGNLDLTFGAGGIVTTPNTSNARGMAIQSDGKIVVAGQATADELALARYNTDGSLDATFGTGGIVVIPENIIGGPPIGVAIQQDGKIVTVAPTDLSMVVFRFNTDELRVGCPVPAKSSPKIESDRPQLVRPAARPKELAFPRMLAGEKELARLEGRCMP